MGQPQPVTEPLCEGAAERSDHIPGCNVRDMEGLLASVVLIAILLGVLLVVSGLVYVLAHRAQRLSKRSTDPVTMRPEPLLGRKPWFGPACGGYRYSPASPEGHAVGLAAIGAAAYLAQAGQLLACAAVAVAMVIIVFVKGAPAGSAREWQAPPNSRT
jgi:hypothetical protein